MKSGVLEEDMFYNPPRRVVKFEYRVLFRPDEFIGTAIQILAPPQRTIQNLMQSKV